MRLRFVYIVAFVLALFLSAMAVVVSTADSANGPKIGEPAYTALYQGKDIHWWAKHAVQARKDANARRATIKRLRRTLHTTYSVSECVTLATIAYPALDLNRAWRIIGGESRGNPNARNSTPIYNGEHAAGLWQFIPSTFNSTPYGKAGMSIWSPCASSLAAGWMHEHGRGKEWTGYGKIN